MLSTDLIKTFERGNLDEVKAEDVNEINRDGYTALMWAIVKDHLDVVKYLIEVKADVNVKNRNGNTALAYAIQNEHLDVKEYLEGHLEECLMKDLAEAELWKKYTYISIGDVVGLSIGIETASSIGVYAVPAIVGLLLGAIAGYAIAGVKKDGDPIEKESWKKVHNEYWWCNWISCRYRHSMLCRNNSY